MESRIMNARWFTRIAVSVLLAVGAAPFGWSADWPAYRADAARSGATSEHLEFPLAPVWEYQPSQAPSPAWPEPGREMHRIDFDYAFQPVIAGGLVYFGSSTDDTLRALDAVTGKLKWRFTTGGPVRFAPHIAGRTCYVAGDDGVVYCLDAATGKLVWEFRAAPEARQMVGNGRMISRWPCRSGVLVLDGVAYVAAGTWPSEGVYVYALDAATGEPLWCNDTSGTLFMAVPKPSTYAMGGVAPQGYLLAAKDSLVVPTGRAVPAVFDRQTGHLIYYEPANQHSFDSYSGGSWVSIAGGMFFNPHHWVSGPNLHVRVGEAGPQRYDSMLARDLVTGSRLWRLDNRHRVAVRGDTLYAVGSGKVEALGFKDGSLGKARWTAEHPRVYCVALAGNALLIGGANSVTAFSTTDGHQAWRGEVEGQVRGIAVADERLLAATDRGAIYCFARRQLQEKPPASGRRRKTIAEDASNVADAVLKLAKGFGIAKGFALVIGQTDTRMAEAIASRTELHVIGVLHDKAKVDAERRRLLDTTDLYGSRLAIHHVPDLASLPYAQYSANLVVVAGEAAEMSGEDLYRVLRPSGGLMCFDGVDRTDAEKLIEQANLPAGEVRAVGDSVVVLRGKLPGAFDWDSEVASDHRLKGSLELLWFGGPGPDKMVARHLAPRGGNTPIAANGRYFTVGEYHVIAVDAYNGTELWARELGEIFAYPYIYGMEVKNKTPIAADDDSVYINFKDFALGPDGRTSEEFNEICLQLDAQSGDVKKIYGELRPSERISLSRPHAFDLKLDKNHSGAVTITKTNAGLKVTLITKDPGVTPRDRWELHFDFRPAVERLAFYGPGAFKVNIKPTPAPGTPPAWQPGLGPVHPVPMLKGGESNGGTRVVYELPLDEIRKLTGNISGEFTFAVTLVLHDGARPLRSHRFADAGPNLINNGWATFNLAPPENDSSRVAAADIPVGSLEDLPDYARKWGRLPPILSSGHRKVLPDYARKWGRLPAPGAQYERLLTSVQPLTLAASERIYRRSHGCSSVISASTMDFFRSGTLGYYDLADGSGLRNFAGIRPGCGMTMVPALGLLISSEGAAGCTCSYNFQTSLALVPAAERSNEDWAVFYDEPGDAFVQHAALNLGAPGDRADGTTVWLGMPRPMSKMNVLLHQRLDLTVPLNFVIREGFGPYRVNADRTPIAGTDRPWVYASGLRGLHRATLDMEYLAGAMTVALPVERPPKIDSRLAEPCWGDGRMIAVQGGKAAVLLRHDEDNLYVAYERPAAIDRKGVSTPWQVTKGDDNPVWEGDAFELYLSDTQAKRCLHLGLSASGARYDGLWGGYADNPFPIFDVPRVEAVSIDGKSDDWGHRGFHVRSVASQAGKMCAADDFDPSFKLGWNDEGLLLLAQVRDDVIGEHSESLELWRADSIELFMAPGGEPDGVVQIALGTGADPDFPKVRTAFWTKTRSGSQVAKHLTAEAAGGAIEGGYVVEALLPWKNIGITPADGKEIGFQMFNTDRDDTSKRFHTAFHPLGHPMWQKQTLHRLRLSRQQSEPVEFMRGEQPGPGGLFAAVEPFPFPCKVTASPVGFSGEDSKYSAEWTSAVNADEDAFTAEVAVPWKALAAAGIKKDKLTIGLDSRGQVLSPPVLRQGYAPVVLSAGEKVPLRAFTVRLHFAELDGARPGERVFDVKLQDKLALENLDVFKEAGGAHRALVKEIKGVTVARAITIEMIPKARQLTNKSVPILSGIEMIAE
jgi:outer membrane protein assembly factor BamB